MLHDDLTGVYNRRHLESEMALPRSTPAGIAIFNIDGLKLINETFGHEAGDRTIVTASNRAVRSPTVLTWKVNVPVSVSATNGTLRL